MVLYLFGKQPDRGHQMASDALRSLLRGEHVAVSDRDLSCAALSIDTMKIPESRAAREHYELRRDPVDHLRDPHVPDDPGILHGFPADQLLYVPQGDWIAKRKTAFAKPNRAWEAFCGAPIRVIQAQNFDTDEPTACPECVELAMLWAGQSTSQT